MKRIVLRRRGPVIVLYVLVFLAAAAVSILTGDRLRYPDEMDYHDLALAIRDGRGYVDAQMRPTAFVPPGYPYFLSGIYRIWNRPLAPKLVNALVLALTAWILSSMAAPAAPPAKFFAPLLVLFYPLFFYTSGTLYPQILGTGLFASSLALLFRFPDSPAASAGAGALFGILILTVPSFMAVLPLAAALLILSKVRSPRNAAVHASLFLLGSVLAVTPWTVRNAVTFKSFIPVSTNSGMNLLLGNSEHTRPNSGVNTDISSAEAQARGLTEVQKDSLFRHHAIQWVSAHPKQAFLLYLRKVLNYFHFRNELGTEQQGSRLYDLLMALTYYPLLGMAVLRFILRRRFPLKPFETMLYVLYFGNAFLAAVFFTRIRFRIPFDALLIVLAASCAGHLFTRRAAPFPRPERTRPRS